jgi:hypothetical protein
MGNTRNTGYLQKIVQYDASNNITLPANLTVTGSITGYATTSYVTTQISNLVNGAPGALDTLNELAAALGNDASFAATLTTSLAGKQSTLTFTGPLVNTSGTVAITQSSGSTNGFLSNTDWTTFNNKQSTLTFSGPLVNTSGTISITQSSGSTNGYLSNTDWTTFNNKQAALSGTGFVKISGTTISYDNSTYLTTASASSTYLPLAGGTLTGALNAPSATFSGSASVINTFNLYKTGGITLGGQLAYDSAVNQLYLWNNVSSGYFSIYTNSVERFKILSGGNVGINTPTPLEVLSVTGNIHIAGVGNSLLFDTDASGRSISQYVTNLYEFHILNSRGNSSRFMLGNGSISLGTSTTPQFFINTSSGNIGMGTTSPLKNLHVYASNGSGIGIGRNLTNNNFSANLFFYPSSTSADKRNWAITTYYGAPGLMEFRRSVTSTSDPYDDGITLMSLDSVTDFVGIGTSTPTAKLHVKGDNARIRVSGGTYTSVEIEDGGTGDPGYIRTYSYGTANCQIGDGGTYFNTGNIGIGLSNPQAILDVSHTAGTTNIIRVSNGAGNYRWRVDQNFSMIMTNASGVDTYSVNTSGGSIQKETAEVKRSGDGDLFIGRFSGGSAKLVYAYQSSADGYLELRTGADAIVTKLSGYTGTPAYMNTKLTVGGTTTYALSTLNVEGSTKMNRSVYNWYQESYVGNSTYLHIKTNLWCGGSPSGNSEYTMSLFKGYMYAYSSPPALEGTICFHNWDGNFYNIGTTGNLFVGAYKSSDGYVVLVTNSGSGEAGLTIDWHQAYGYPFRDRVRTASKLYGSTTGGY